MGKTKTSGKGRLDKYYHLAKEQGYRSRAAFKLVQLDKKYQFLAKSHALLDLCAAPGGWLQVAAKYMPVSSVIIGVDLVPIRAIRGCTTFTQDITTPACRAEIKKILNGRLLDVVLHDGSPNVGGAWAKEALGQAALSLESLKLATEFLRPGGLFVSKVFRSQDYNALLFAFKQLFNRVEATKPVASRQTSAEIYVICQGYKAPGQIDPRLLDVRTIFQEVAEEPKPVDVFRTTNRKKFREGYEPGLSLIHKESTASAFMRSENAVEFLGTYHQIKFETDDCKRILKHKETNAEIKDLCDDLQVLGKREFKQLLKWRMGIRRDMPDLVKAERKEKAGEEAEEGDEGEEGEGEGEEGEGEGEGEAAEGDAADPEAAREEVIMEEMLELKDYLAARQKGFEKRVKKRREKAKARAATGLSTDAVDEGMYQDEDLFSLVTIKTRKHLGRLDEAAMDEEQQVLEEEEEEEEGEEGDEEEEESDDGDLDEDKFKKRYEADLEAYFDDAYDRYCKAKEGSSRRRARARLQGDEAEAAERDTEEPAPEEGEEGEEGEGGGEGVAGGIGGLAGEDDEAAPGSENPLLVKEGGRSETAVGRGQRMAAQWFSQDVFQGLEMPAEAPAAPGHPAGEGAPRNDKGGVAEKGKGGSTRGGVEAAKEKKDKKGRKEEKGGGEQEVAELQGTKRAKANVLAATKEGTGKSQKGANGVVTPALPGPAAPVGAVSSVATQHAKGQGKLKGEGADVFPSKGRAKAGPGGGLVAFSQDDGEFEVVPVAEDLSDSDPERAQGSESDSDSEEEGGGQRRVEVNDEDYDSDAKAETLAYAHRMLRKRQREDIIDSAYNRYTFDDDPKALPKWFQDDERKHLRALQPITKEEVEAMKAEFRAVDARPAKKVAEAKARKRRRLTKQMEQVRQKASAIADQEDLNARAKSRQMERLYRNAASNAKADTRKEVVVAKKGNQGSRGRYAKGKLMVDKRMLADKRGEDRAAKKGKGKGRGKGKGNAKGGKGQGSKGGKATSKKTGKGRSSAR